MNADAGASLTEHLFKPAAGQRIGPPARRQLDRGLAPSAGAREADRQPRDHGDQPGLGIARIGPHRLAQVAHLQKSGGEVVGAFVGHETAAITNASSTGLRRAEIIQRIKSAFRAPDYEYHGG